MQFSGEHQRQAAAGEYRSGRVKCCRAGSRRVGRWSGRGSRQANALERRFRRVESARSKRYRRAGRGCIGDRTTRPLAFLFPFLFPFTFTFTFTFTFAFFEARGPAGPRERRCRSSRRTSHANFAQCASECAGYPSVCRVGLRGLARSSSVVREKPAEILKQLYIYIRTVNKDIP